MGFDLTKNNLAEKSEAGYEFELTLPEVGTPTDAFITVRGVQSAKVKAFSRKKYQEFQTREQMARKRGKDVEPMSLEEAEDMAIDSALVRIISWRGFEEKGKPLEFNEDNARRVLREHAWIREQILTESDSLVNFI